MRNLHLLSCCVVLAGCSRGTVGLPIATDLNVGAMDAAHRSQLSFARASSYGVASFKTIYSFKGGTSDGAFPNAGLIEINGTLFGTTGVGGGGCGGQGCGTVFKLSSSGSESILHSFKGGYDGRVPDSSLIDVNGSLLGTTFYGGRNCHGQFYCGGTVFKITPSGTESVLYGFKGGSDGVNPIAGLIDANGTLYGTTVYGGDAGERGTVFKLSMSGAESVLHSFTENLDGAEPWAALINVDGTFYGTTHLGGASNSGTVFKISRSGTETVVYSFKGGSDGAGPVAGLVDVNGALYGTTGVGGTGTSCYESCGTVFKMTFSGAETVLYNFKGGSDGNDPWGVLTNVGGTLYGTTYAGGGSGCYGGYGCGTVFKITASGTESVIHSFTGAWDGATPRAGLLDVNGTLYGTTYAGGKHGVGTVFSILL